MQSSQEGVGAWPHRSDADWPQRSELRAWFAGGPGGGDDISPSRRDTLKAARVFELVAQPEESSTPTRSHARLAAAFAGALGVVVGLLLALLLAHTAFAPDNDCRAAVRGVAACAHAAR
jgi:hypothetical protein